MKEYNCRVCGFDNYPDEFWENNSPMYIICPCCGCESGNEDYDIKSIKKYREEWLNKGAIWFNEKIKPKDWDLLKQLKNITSG